MDGVDMAMGQVEQKQRAVPPQENLTRIGATDFESYVKLGEILKDQLHEIFARFDSVPQKGMQVLDFGCGIGRVTFPVAETYGAKIFACDVDPTAIKYVQENSDRIEAFVSNYDPPLPFEDSTLDVVYANSVWTHFPQDAETMWLKEMRRITKPGARLFLSVAARETLKAHQARGLDDGVTLDLLEEKGFIFIENMAHDKNNPERWPGVTHEYGLTRHSHDYIRNTWSKYFRIVDIVEAGSGRQDVIVLENIK